MSRGLHYTMNLQTHLWATARQAGRTATLTPGCRHLLAAEMQSTARFLVMFPKEVGKHPARLKYALVIWLSADKLFKEQRTEKVAGMGCGCRLQWQALCQANSCGLCIGGSVSEKFSSGMWL